MDLRIPLRRNPAHTPGRIGVVDRLMSTFTPDFTLEVEGVKGVCPAGGKYAQQMWTQKLIPVLPTKDRAFVGKGP